MWGGRMHHLMNTTLACCFRFLAKRYCKTPSWKYYRHFEKVVNVRASSIVLPDVAVVVVVVNFMSSGGHMETFKFKSRKNCRRSCILIASPVFRLFKVLPNWKGDLAQTMYKNAQIWWNWYLCFIYFFIAFYWEGFTVAQRERAQEDCKVPCKGAPPHPTPPFVYERQPQHWDQPTLFE